VLARQQLFKEGDHFGQVRQPSTMEIGASEGEDERLPVIRQFDQGVNADTFRFLIYQRQHKGPASCWLILGRPDKAPLFADRKNRLDQLYCKAAIPFVAPFLANPGRRLLDDHLAVAFEVGPGASKLCSSESCLTQAIQRTIRNKAPTSGMREGGRGRRAGAMHEHGVIADLVVAGAVRLKDRVNQVSASSIIEAAGLSG